MSPPQIASLVSRRTFLLGGIGLGQLLICPPALARGRAKQARTGLRSIARQDWPPAIVPDHVVFIDRANSCLSDQFGRVAIIDLKRARNPAVIGELTVDSKKIIDFSAARHRGYLLALQESSTGDSQYALVTVSLAPMSEPSVLNRVVLDRFSEATAVAASADLVCVGGVTARGDNQIAVYSVRGRSGEPALLSTFKVPLTIAALDLLDRNLAVLEAGNNSQVDYVSLLNGDAPQLRKSMKLDGDFRVWARSKNTMMVAGQSSTSGVVEVKTISLEPAPHVMQSETLHELTTVYCATAQKDRFYLLGESGSSRALVELAMGRDLRLSPGQTLELPGARAASEAPAAIAVRDGLINIASGWQGVDVLTRQKSAWRLSFTYTIPRLPASAVAAWEKFVVLAGSDLKLYDITSPERPVLVETADAGSTLKSIATAGPYILCLGRNKLLLRRVDKLSETIDSLDLIGQDMTFDLSQRKAYVLSARENKTLVTPVAAYSNRLIAGSVLTLPAGYRRLLAGDGHLLLIGLDKLAVYDPASSVQPLGQLSFDSLAVRDVSFSDRYLVATAVDRSSNGHLLVLSRQDRELSRVGAVDLPCDGVALAVSGNRAAVVGRRRDGQDLVSIIDLSVPAMPKVIASLPSVEASSAVTINKDRLAIVVGRGLEIVSLG